MTRRGPSPPVPHVEGLVAPATPPPPRPPPVEQKWPAWVMGLLVLGLLASLAAVRIVAPSDLYDNDQPAPVAHILDAASNRHWLMQRQPSGTLATKPPVYPWLGALAVKTVGRTDEWVFKLPLLAAMAVGMMIVWDLARRPLGAPAGWVAAAFWIANFHVFKLAYTARTDMLVTAFVLLAVWCVQRQREAWSTHWEPRTAADGEDEDGSEAAPGPREAPTVWIALFWACVAAAALTKGPPALLPVLWLAVAVAWDRPAGRHRPRAQLAGFLLACALVLAWLVPALIAYPQWWGNLRAEVVDRVVGEGTGSHRHTPMLAMPGYLFARFAPWSVLSLMGVGALVIACNEFAADDPLAKGRTTWQVLREHPVTWAVLWVLLVLIVFMVPRGRRADYLLPAHAGAAVLAAWLVRQAQQTSGLHRIVTHLTLGGVAIACVVAGVASWWVPRPEPLAFSVLDQRVAGAVAEWDGGWIDVFRSAAGALGAMTLGLGASALRFVHLRRYLVASVLAAAGVGALLGVFQLTLADSARAPYRVGSLFSPELLEREERTARSGDLILATARVARESRRHAPKAPLVFYDVGYTPIQALLGRHEPMDESALERVRGGGTLVAGAEGWRRVRDRFEGRGSVMSLTPALDESGVQLVVVRIDPPGTAGRPATGPVEP